MYIKKLNKIFKYLFIKELILLLIVLLFSCKKENYVNYKTTFNPHPPLISAVTDLNNRNQNLTSAVNGDWIIIKGNNLGTTYKITFNNVAVADSLFSADDTTITVKIPADLPDPENNPITIITKYGTTGYSLKIVQPSPIITSFTPSIGGAETEVTLNGYYFLGTTNVKLNNIDLTFNLVSKTQIKVKIPANIISGYFFVTTPSGTTKAAISYGISYLIYNDSLTSGWNNTSYSTSVLFTNSSNFVRGTNSIKINYTVGFGGFRLSKTVPISAVGYTAIKFSLFGSTNSDGFKIRVILNGNNTSTVTLPTITAGIWTQIEIPLSTLGNPTTISSIELKEYSGRLFEILVDDLGFL